jgi:hypothetical protein
MEAEMARKTNEASAEMKTVVITADHVFLPLDEDGNAVVEWRDCPGRADELGNFERPHPTKVNKRTRLQVSTDLAAFLSKRDQAEVL